MRRYKDSKYLIFKDGLIKNEKTGRYLKQQNNGRGYMKVTLTINGIQIQRYVHRLIAEYFVDNPFNKKQVNHKDGNKQNNYYSNIEWVTNQENRDHAVKNELVPSGVNHYRSKLNKSDIEEIIIFDLDGYKRKDIARIFNVSKSTVSDILNGNRYKNLCFVLSNKELKIND